MNGPLDYTAFGLCVRSSIPLPLGPACGAAHHEPDVTVRIGEAPALPPSLPGKGEFWQMTPGAFWFTVDDVARYHVAEGRRILVEPRGGSRHDLGVFLIRSGFAALLLQRGVVPFHASAIATDAGAVLFAGCSGAGKSSLLAALVERGHTMLADDLTGVIRRDGRAIALPAFPNIGLWADALDALDWRRRAGERVREPLEKFLAPVARFRDEPLAVRALYALGPGPEITVGKAPSQAALELLCRHTYRRRFLPGSGQRMTHFRTVAHMANRLPVFRVTRPAYPFLIDALADRVEAGLATLS